MANVLVKEPQQALPAAAEPRRRAPAPGVGERRPLWRSDGALAMLFLSPTMLVFGTFILFPILFSFYLSFEQWNMFGATGTFVGLDNYERMFSDPEFWRVVRNTAIYTVGTVPLNMVLALLAAYYLNKRIAGKKFLRAAFFTPVIISSVAAAVIWRWIFDPNMGALNFLLEALGLPAVAWLNDRAGAMTALIAVGVWKTFGVNMILYAAGLTGIPDHYYEAAEMDGAGPWRRFWNITLPLLSPTTLFILVLSLISSFQVFDLVYVLTYGGPLGSTKVLVYYLYEQAFKFFDMGYASAVAYFLFAVLFIVTMTQIRFFKGRGYETA
ncbi:MAG TPA: sugar ABC transporter permease [Rhodothermales bacterium]|nr:sugar ABC transporter permease [Rhodothermales bacterium]